MTELAAPAKTVKPRRRSGRGALVLLALLLAGSGAIRLGLGIGAAMARSTSEADAPAETPQMQSETPVDCPALPVALAAALSKREAQVAAQEVALEERKRSQEAAIDERTAALALTDKAVGERLVMLEQAEANLSKTVAQADGAAEGDLAKLTAVYEAMKPKDASAVFGAMTPEFAAGFLGRMKPEAAAAVLAGMKPEAAYAVSVILAGRNALAPKE